MRGVRRGGRPHLDVDRRGVGPLPQRESCLQPFVYRALQSVFRLRLSLPRPTVGVPLPACPQRSLVTYVTITEEGRQVLERALPVFR
jgi:hypothetical protein